MLHVGLLFFHKTTTASRYTGWPKKGNWTTRRQTNSRSVKSRTGHLAD